MVWVGCSIITLTFIPIDNTLHAYAALHFIFIISHVEFNAIYYSRYKCFGNFYPDQELNFNSPSWHPNISKVCYVTAIDETLARKSFPRHQPWYDILRKEKYLMKHAQAISTSTVNLRPVTFHASNYNFNINLINSLSTCSCSRLPNWMHYYAVLFYPNTETCRPNQISKWKK